MAVALVIGNNPRVNTGLLETGSTIPTALVNFFGEADDAFRPFLLALGLLLLTLTLFVNIIARIVLTNPGLLKAPFRGIGAAFRRISPRKQDATAVPWRERVAARVSETLRPVRRFGAKASTRRALDWGFTAVGLLAAAIAVVPLFLVISYVTTNGAPVMFEGVGVATESFGLEGYEIQDALLATLVALGTAAALGALVGLALRGAARRAIGRARLLSLQDAATSRGAFWTFTASAGVIALFFMEPLALLDFAVALGLLAALPLAAVVALRGAAPETSVSFRDVRTGALLAPVIAFVALWWAVDDGNYLIPQTYGAFQWQLYLNYPWIEWGFLTGTAPTFFVAGAGGGISHAIVGSLYAVGLAAAIGIPVGILGGLFLAEYARGTVANILRNASEVLAATPSILIGLFGYIVFVLSTGEFSILAGGLTLSLMVAPVVMRTTELSLRTVPVPLREAGVALGASYWRTLLTIVLPSARGPIATGALLGTARVAGETAPLLFTALYSEFLLDSLDEPSATLPTLIWKYTTLGFPEATRQAWGAAFLLLLFVLVVNVGVRLLLNRSRKEA
ncbi:MAG TPA: phosphate ABC transporter permease PstA [Candidatus Thermoplasmatota archaeon]|nr:phosphate ABC transporter permease PstA [Candidatus Thermoplasmatota archaeon]